MHAFFIINISMNILKISHVQWQSFLKDLKLSEQTHEINGLIVCIKGQLLQEIQICITKLIKEFELMKVLHEVDIRSNC